MQANTKPQQETFVAGATAQATPRVAVVLSSYKGGPDHFGNAQFAGLPEPKPAGSPLTEAQLIALTRRAIELSNHPNRNMRRLFGRNESIGLLVNRQTESPVLTAVLAIIRENVTEAKVTVLSNAPRQVPGVAFVNTATAESIRMPAPGVWSRRDVTYRVPKALLDCERVISIAPLAIENGRPALTFANYRSLVASKELDEVAELDLFGFHPADYTVLGGSRVLRNGGEIRHNLVLASAVVPAADTVAAALLNIKPGSLRNLQTANERGFGEANLDAIWTLGNEIEDARIAS